jgi:hypothetical protein
MFKYPTIHINIPVIILEIIVPNIAKIIIFPIFFNKYFIYIVNADSNTIGGSKAIKNI